ncbi:MAG: formylglycine-generating enzyme family protein [Bacteroidota bacterium]
MLHLPETLCLANLEENMIHIPGGTFMMGGESFKNDALPEHLVSLDDFYLCRFPVSQKLWEEVMGEKPSWYQNPRRPVEQISWNWITNKFLPALRNKTGIEDYRLPTEAQWEYAARGGEKGVWINRDSFEFSGSNDLKEVAWYKKNSLQETQSMGLKRPNVLGLYGMSGNVWERCQDWHDPNYYRTLKDQHGENPARNPAGPKDGWDKVVRGGAWLSDNLGYFRPSNHLLSHPADRYDSLGFRLSRYSPT